MATAWLILPLSLYTFKSDNYLRGTKIRFGINNLLNQHNIVGVAPASTKSNAPAPGDILTLLPARSISLTMTFEIGRAHV